MSPTLFAGLVAGAILVAVFGVALIAMLVVRERGESRLRSRLAPEVDAAADFEDRHPRPMVASMVRGGKAIEGLVDAEGESGRLLMRAGWRGVDQRVLWYSFQGVLPILLGAVSYTHLTLPTICSV